MPLKPVIGGFDKLQYHNSVISAEVRYTVFVYQMRSLLPEDLHAEFILSGNVGSDATLHYFTRTY